MTNRIEPELLARSQQIVILLKKGERHAARTAIAQTDRWLKENPVTIEDDVEALWIQIGIAASNPHNERYLLDVEDQLNGLTFRWSNER